MKIRFLSVSEVNNYINRSIKADPILQHICVYGEISNLRLSTGGYLFFSLKDSVSKLDCVSFEPKSLDINIKEGMEVELVGNLSFYQKDASLRLIVKQAKTVGIGKAFEEFLQLAKTLEKEGLFLSSRKKKIKEIPETLGVITSTAGAVLQDIKNVSSTRYPQCEIIVYPAKVQGDDAAYTVIKGIEYFNKVKNVDTIIIARGGGSYEDLAQFNNELLARAVAKSSIPIISAIGHETDNTILDLVADLRAATPSVAAQLALPSKKQLSIELDQIMHTINAHVNKKLLTFESDLDNYKKILEAHSPKNTLLRKTEQLDNKYKELKYIAFHQIGIREKALETLGGQLSILNPILPYKKGFAVIKKDGNIINSTKLLSQGDEVSISFEDGEKIACIK